MNFWDMTLGLPCACNYSGFGARPRRLGRPPALGRGAIRRSDGCGSMRPRRRLRRVALGLVTGLPAALMLFVLFPFVRNVYNVHHVDPDQVVSRIEGWLGTRGEYCFAELRHPFMPRYGKTIYVYGGSSVVISDSDEELFPANVFSGKLRLLMRDVVVANYGESGVDSFYIRDVVRATCERRQPDLIIVYTGHNDYTNAYRRAVRPAYSVLRGTVFLPMLRHHHRFRDDTEWHMDYNFEPKVHTMLANLRLMTPDDAHFKRYDRAIEKHFAANLGSIVRYAQGQKITVLLIPPISNIYVRPVGNRDLIAEFEESLEIKDYAERTRRLMRIRERDWLSPDVRARRGIVRHLQSLEDKTQGVFLLGLEGELMRREWGFGYKEIWDYFHFTEATHETVARIVADYLRKWGLP